MAKAIVTGTFEVALADRWNHDSAMTTVFTEASEAAHKLLVEALKATNVRLIGPLRVRQVLAEEEP